MTPPKAPTPHPCVSCPYRRDVPSGVWEADEYLKLPPYDNETWEQPPAVFMCHQENGHLCSGWCGTHDMDDNLGLRIAAQGMDPAELKATLDYESPVPLWDSGAQAAKHGLSEIETPGESAQRVMRKLTARRERRSA